jgi:hypothetical protein
MAPPLIIIAGAFTFTGYALNAADWLYYGRNRRTRIDEFIFRLDKRDEELKRMVKAAAATDNASHTKH